MGQEDWGTPFVDPEQQLGWSLPDIRGGDYRGVYPDGGNGPSGLGYPMEFETATGLVMDVC